MMSIVAHHIICTVISPDHTSAVYNYLDLILHTAVVIFVLISGYFGINFKLGKLLRFEGQVLFYSSIIGCIAFFFIQSIDIKELIHCFMPSSYKLYWFVSAYLGLYLISPLLNTAFQNMSKRKHLYTIIVLMFCINTINSLPAYEQASNIGLMITLYALGRYLKSYDVNWLKSNKNCLSVLLGIAFFVLPIVACFCVNIEKEKIWNVFYNYYGIGCIFISVLIFSIFKNMFFTSKILNRFAASVFAIYLIHENHLISEYVYVTPTLFLNKYLPMSLSLLLVTTTVTMGGLLMDQIRISLFQKLNGTFDKMSSSIEVQFTKIANKI